jgi:predicted 2-oxoglutarate/Fe(II)-dependent dioxygenase YbiX
MEEKIAANQHASLEMTLEPRAGRVIIFSSGTENTHFVEQVISGKRFVLSFWFTCDARKEFNIFLDGKAHITFSHKFRDQMIERMRQQQQQQKAQKNKPKDSKKEL